MDKFYNILWIDDEHESLNSTKGRAKRNGIHLFAYKSLNGGVDELEKNYSFYDGVLLDAKFFENEDDVTGTEDTVNIHRAKDRLLQLKKKFEIFVLTGQAEAYEDNTFNKAFTKVYQKGSDPEMQRLFDDIKVAASSQPEFQLRNKYQNILGSCEETYLGKEYYEKIFYLIKEIENPELIRNSEDNFTAIRKIIEKILGQLTKAGVIPEEITSPNNKSRFLSTNQKLHPDYNHLTEIIHPAVADSFFKLIEISSDASHTTSTLRIQIDDYLKQSKSDYLYRGYVYQLLEIIRWFKEFMDNNSDIEANKAKWERIETSSDWVKGIVVEIKTNGWGAFENEENGTKESIHPNQIKKYNLISGQEIQVKLEYQEDKNKNHITEINTTP